MLDGQDPAAVSEKMFDDVDATSFHAPFIERMAELGVTAGCGDGMFCPDRNVSRAQMAVFLSGAYRLPDGPDPGFADVPGHAWYAADVAKLAAAKITAGCGDGIFCPEDDVRRAQMATFLYRAGAVPAPLETVDYKPDQRVALVDRGSRRRRGLSPSQRLRDRSKTVSRSYASRVAACSSSTSNSTGGHWLRHAVTWPRTPL